MTDPDPLAHWLAPPPDTDPNPARRAELLALTASTLRRPTPWTNWLGRAALLLLGVGIGWTARPTPPPVTRLIEVPVEVEVQVEVEPEVPVARTPPEPPRTPEQLELAAELADDRAEAARLYRAAGDAFLTPRRDYAEAARCYRLSLQTAPPETRAVTAADSWLLARVKTTIPTEVSP